MELHIPCNYVPRVASAGVKIIRRLLNSLQNRAFALSRCSITDNYRQHLALKLSKCARGHHAKWQTAIGQQTAKNCKSQRLSTVGHNLNIHLTLHKKVHKYSFSTHFVSR